MSATPPVAPATDAPEAAAPAAPPAPAYAQLVARRPYIWGGRRLATGEVVIDLRARGGAGDLKVFTDLLRWSAFKVDPVAGPPAQPVPAPQSIVGGLDDATLALRMRIADLECELAKFAGPINIEQKLPNRADFIRQLAGLAPEDLKGMPGVGPKKAAELLEWAKDILPTLPPEPMLEDASQTELPKA